MKTTKATHCTAGQNCAIAYGTPASLDVPAEFMEHDDGSVSGPVEHVATFWMAHGFDIAKFDVIGTVRL